MFFSLTSEVAVDSVKMVPNESQIKDEIKVEGAFMPRH